MLPAGRGVIVNIGSVFDATRHADARRRCASVASTPSTRISSAERRQRRTALAASRSKCPVEIPRDRRRTSRRSSMVCCRRAQSGRAPSDAVNARVAADRLARPAPSSSQWRRTNTSSDDGLDSAALGSARIRTRGLRDQKPGVRQLHHSPRLRERMRRSAVALSPGSSSEVRSLSASPYSTSSAAASSSELARRRRSATGRGRSRRAR